MNHRDLLEGRRSQARRRFDCPRCGALKGFNCLGTRGDRKSIHMDRLRLAERGRGSRRDAPVSHAHETMQ